ncbi:Methyltransf_2 domain-containing protein/Dimerisation domain-containing protein [Cephalotus follicularis]|uniref:Methyltransf_2 domain-containing protein/Dimerisation domain-containing protein n=1 Tax=Cephalotus follicularis TaxID=3775 RepID=A0A1Q3C4B1_CEPFO|nr:Methyltransf_2 domain-containing protein/Dimerisation domain-containing protein [Cephalotus follicularis]
MRTSINEEDNHAQYAMQLASASVLPMVLKATIELGVLDIINSAGPGALLSPSQIASMLPTKDNPDAPFMLDCILRLLASHSILTCSLVSEDHDSKVHRLYGLAPAAKYFIQNQDEGSLAPLINLIQDKTMLNIWYHLKDSVLEGGFPFNRAYGLSAFEYASKDSRFSEIFKCAMIDFNTLFMEKILVTYKGFEGLKSLVDVGGGNGSILQTIISKYPSIKGINYDLATVVENLPSYPGIVHVAGDMFKSIPKGFWFIKQWILHDWNDSNCIKILKNCYEALPANGKVIVVDMVIPEDPEANVAYRSLFQLYMFLMNMNIDRKERTQREYGSLAKEAGFSFIQVPSCAFNFSVVEFNKTM